MKTNREFISELLSDIKNTGQDRRVSKRQVWYKIYDAANLILDRELTDKKLWRQTNLWTPICVEMEEIPAILCTCVQVDNGCTIYRSKNKLPKLFSSRFGYAIFSVTSIDVRTNNQIIITTPETAKNSAKVKGVSDKYGFIVDDYLYLLNAKFKALTVYGLFEDDVTAWQCNSQADVASCWMNQKVFFPERLYDNVKRMALELLFKVIQVPQPNNNDKDPNR